MKFQNFFGLFFSIFLFAFPLYAETVKQAHTEVEFISESSAVTPGQTFYAGLRFKMDPQWHIYWINPGDSGMAPKIQWRLPEGWSSGPLLWPYPEKIEQPPLASYGYKDEVLLMSAFHVPATQVPGKVVLKTTVNWLTCKVDCIPGKTELSLHLAVKTAAETDTRWVRLFSETRGRHPLDRPELKIEALISTLPSPEKLRLRVTSYAGSGELYFFPESSDLILHAAPQVFREAGLEIPLASSRKIPERLRGLLLSSDGWRGPGSEKGLWVDVPLTAAAETLPAVPGMTILTALLFAFLGGLILNLMPCVLPVLSLKILGFMQEAAENPGSLFKHGLAFTAGVIVSFWSLAGILILFQAAGKFAGWGFQLQSPFFLVLLTFIFFLFALNLFSIFEIGLSLTGIRQPGMRKKGLAGSFSSGVFATVVATPCTAPFMGAALGFSLSQPPPVSFLIFTALGLGMAAPYLLLCSQPAFLRFVPKPGAWMITLKKILALPLLATCAWLLWILTLQRGTGILMPVLTGLVCAFAGAWILGKYAATAPEAKTRRSFFSVSLILILSGLLLGLQGVRFNSLEREKNWAETSGHKIAWEPFSEARLQSLLKEGKPVFVDFTAAWCLTCQVNERVALDIPKVAAAFREAGVTTLKADWTSQDPEITRALSRYGRNSIPLYVLYKPGDSRPALLPELLTPGIVLESLKNLKEK